MPGTLSSVPAKSLDKSAPRLGIEFTWWVFEEVCGHCFLLSGTSSLLIEHRLKLCSVPVINYTRGWFGL